MYSDISLTVRVIAGRMGMHLYICDAFLDNLLPTSYCFIYNRSCRNATSPCWKSSPPNAGSRFRPCSKLRPLKRAVREKPLRRQRMRSTQYRFVAEQHRVEYAQYVDVLCWCAASFCSCSKFRSPGRVFICYCCTTWRFSQLQPDDPINFVQLLAKVDPGSLEDQFELSLSAAVGTLPQKKEVKDPAATKLNKVGRFVWEPQS